MDGGQDYVLDSYGMLPELSFFDPIMNISDLPVTNKDKVVKVKKMSLVIFPTQSEELSKFETETIHKWRETQQLSLSPTTPIFS